MPGHAQIRLLLVPNSSCWDRLSDLLMLQVVVGHNGPTGLGSERHSPVGNDFQTVRGSEGECPAA